MATYWIAFRLFEGTVQKQPYTARYEALVAAIDNLAAGPVWKDPPCFALFQSTASPMEVAEFCEGAIVQSHDMFLVYEIDTDSAVICGDIHDEDIFKVLPYVQKL